MNNTNQKIIHTQTATVTVATTDGRAYSFEVYQKASPVDPYWSSFWDREFSFREPWIDLEWTGQDYSALAFFFPVYSSRRGDYPSYYERVSFLSVDGKSVTLMTCNIVGFKVETRETGVQKFRSEPYCVERIVDNTGWRRLLFWREKKEIRKSFRWVEE
jgi:hypothetical protein